MTQERRLEALIFNGTNEDPANHPYLAALLPASGKDPLCAGIAIANRWILSAGHCWTRHRVSVAYFPGPKKEIQMLDGIVHVSRDLVLFPLNKNAPTSWPRRILEPDAADRFVALGWGATGSGSTSTRLQISQPIPMLSQDDCRDAHPDLADHEFCAGSDVSGTCKFDSGGPLFSLLDGEDTAPDALVGITTRGSEPCASRFDVYTRIDCDWIRSRVGNDTGCGGS